jgi:hypothetical protein
MPSPFGASNRRAFLDELEYQYDQQDYHQYGYDQV